MHIRLRIAGLTLIEIMITILITALIMSFVGGVLLNMINQRDEVESSSIAWKIGPAILNLISRDLEATFVYQLDELKKEEAKNAAEAEGEEGNGGSGDETTSAEEMEVNYFIGEDHGDDEDAYDSLQFVTSLDSKLRIGNKQSDIVEVGYYLVQNDEGDLYTLYRREDFFIDTDPVDGGKAIKIYDRVKALDFKYYEQPTNESEYQALAEGNAEFKYEWDNTLENGIPYAVEVSIWIDLTEDKVAKKNPKYAKVYKFRTLVQLPAYPKKEQLTENESNGGTTPPR